MTLSTIKWHIMQNVRRGDYVAAKMLLRWARHYGVGR